MNVVHVGMVYASPERTIYRAQIVACRWINKARGKWSGRHVRDLPDKIESGPDTHSRSDREQCDRLAREVAKREGLPAGPDCFPFA